MDALLQLGELREIDRYPGTVARLLRETIPCEISSYTAVDPVSGHTRIAADPLDSLFDGGDESFGRFAMQNPLVENYARTGDGRALRISDFITSRQLHSTELYEHLYGRLEIEYQLAITLPPLHRAPARPQEMIGLTLSRATRDFDPREQQLLELLRPHLSSALERLHEMALATALGDGQDRRDWATLVDRNGVVAVASTAAAVDFGLYPGEALPCELREWVSRERSRVCERAPAVGPSTAAVALQGRSLLARLQPRVHGELDSLRLLPLGGPPGVAQLLTLGLTRRQAAVLELALQGHSSPSIARALALSPRTVEKHFEAIYARLGVSGRAQVILCAMQILNPGSSAH